VPNAAPSAQYEQDIERLLEGPDEDKFARAAGIALSASPFPDPTRPAIQTRPSKVASAA
jgi:hypothetical protein